MYIFLPTVGRRSTRSADANARTERQAMTLRHCEKSTDIRETDMLRSIGKRSGESVQIDFRGVNLEEEKVGYGGKDLQKMKVLSLEYKSERTEVIIGLPDLPYFTGDPVFQTRSPASRGGEAAGKNKSPVFC